METSEDKTKVMIISRKPVRREIVINNVIMEQVMQLDFVGIKLCMVRF